jgi:hypothetical protein
MLFSKLKIAKNLLTKEMWYFFIILMLKEQRAKSKEQRAKSKEQRAKSKEQRAKSKEIY